LSRLDRKVRRLQRRNSQSHAFFLFFVLIIAFGAAVVARYYALEPVQIMDSSMSPKFKERSIVWVCKLPQCVSQVKDLDNVLARVHSDEAIFRRVLAVPGDTISISDKGKVITSKRNFKWKGEDAFIQSRSVYVPKVGDTLYFNKLNDVEQDYLISLLRSEGIDVFVKTTLWQGDHEINIDRVGATKIANRQVSLKEIDFLPWQDRYLIELQIRRSEPGNSPIKLKRKLFRRKFKQPPPPDTLALDTLKPDSMAKQDSSTSPDSLAQVAMVPPPKPAPQPGKIDTLPPPPPPPPPPEEISEEINQVVIDRDCFFLACEKGSNCPDSRELGYFTTDRIVGLHLKKPDEIKKKFIDPAATYLRGAYAIARDLWHAVRDAGNKAYDFVAEKIETIKGKDNSEEESEESENNE